MNSRPARGAGTLYLCGLGPLPERTATVQTLQALASCDAVYYEGAKEQLEPLLHRYCRDVRPAGPSSSKGIEGRVRRGETIGLVAPGIPLAFGDLAAGLLARCRHEGLSVHCLAAMSHADMLLAHTGDVLGYELGGVSIIDHAALAGAADLNAGHPLFVALSPAGRPAALRRDLERFYSPEHPCRIFSPAGGLTETFPLRALADRPLDAASALILPARRRR